MARPKVEKPKRIKLTDIKADIRTYADLCKKQGIKKTPEQLERWEGIIFPYFKSIPSELVVTRDVPVGTRVWAARDFIEGKRKEVYFISKHIASPTETVVEALDSENIRKIFVYDAVCLVPDTHRSAKIKTIDQLAEHVKEIKAEAKANRKKKDKKK